MACTAHPSCLFAPGIPGSVACMDDVNNSRANRLGMSHRRHSLYTRILLSPHFSAAKMREIHGMISRAVVLTDLSEMGLCCNSMHVHMSPSAPPMALLVPHITDKQQLSLSCFNKNHHQGLPDQGQLLFTPAHCQTCFTLVEYPAGRWAQ